MECGSVVVFGRSLVCRNKEHFGKKHFREVKQTVVIIKKEHFGKKHFREVKQTVVIIKKEFFFIYFHVAGPCCTCGRRRRPVTRRAVHAHLRPCLLVVLWRRVACLVQCVGMRHEKSSRGEMVP